MTKLLITICLSFLPCALHADTYLLNLKENLENIQKNFSEDGQRTDFSFKKTTISNGKSILLEEFNPSQPKQKQWRLLLSNGKPPTEDEIEKYQQNIASNSIEGYQLYDIMQHFRLNSNALSKAELLENSEHFRTYKVHIENKKNIPNDLSGSSENMIFYFKLNKSTMNIQSIGFKLAKKLKPSFSTSINKMDLSFNFFQEPETGLMLLKEFRTEIRGKALFVKKIDMLTIVEYSNYIPAKTTSSEPHQL